MSWEDFPRGFAEYGDNIPPLLFEPGDRLYDVGLEHYGEFITGLESGFELLKTGLVLNGVRGTVHVVQRFTNGVQMKWRPLAETA